MATADAVVPNGTAAKLANGSLAQSEKRQHGAMYIQTISINHSCGILAKILGYLLDLVQLRVIGTQTNPNRDYLQGRFAPIREEIFKEALQVEGTVPPELQGAYLRTGPNPQMDPTGGYHWFDGDGMIHAARVKDGTISYCNRFVQTYRLKKERAAKHQLFPRFGDYMGWRGLVLLITDNWKKQMGYLDKSQGGGAANTALTYHAGRIMSLHEGDLPYQIRVLCEGLLETVGRVKVGDWDIAFTAHPKIDKETGVLHFFGYSVARQPHAKYGAIGPDGTLVSNVPIELPYPTMMHDFVITKNYAILAHLPMCFEPKEMVKNKKLPFVFKRDFKARFGVLPLCAKDAAAIRWFEFPYAFMVFHFANAWEEGNTIKIFGNHQPDIDLDSKELSHFKKHPDFGMMAEYTLDLDTGNCSHRLISTKTGGDFPVINPNKCGRPCKWAWFAKHPSIEDKDPTRFSGIAKVDLTVPEGVDGLVGVIEYPAGYVGGEAIFVPRYEDPSKCQGEDDGFLVVYITTQEAPHLSKFMIYDAVTMSSTPLASTNIPQTVPLGFHGTWVTASELAAQAV